MIRFLMFMLFVLMFAPCYAKETANRPKVGLALGGGGAKGSAHIGVIRALEQLRVPVDYVAGTSMGSYIATLYALGLSADEIEAQTLAVDWMSGYSDMIERHELSYRDKKIQDRFQIDIDIGFDGERIRLPSGFIQGETMARLLRQATRNSPNFDSFDTMPIPLRTVALDLATMQPYIFKSGNLVTAMQASMAIPGALKPIEYDGRLLADGGLVNNLPVDVLKEMGADVVIAVDVGGTLSEQSELGSYLEIIDQLVTHMTNSSVQKQLGIMGEEDILIRPKVSDIGVGDFTRLAEAIPLGEEAANELHLVLSAFSVSRNEYLQYLTNKKQIREGLAVSKNIVVDDIKIVSNLSLDSEIMKAALGIEVGGSYSQEALEKMIRRLYAQDLYERVDYEVVRQGKENVLVVTVRGKSWGPGFFDMLLSTESAADGNTDVTFGLGYTLTDINALGAQWRNEFIIGTRTDVNTRFYTPLDNELKFYWEAIFGYDRQLRNLYLNDLDVNRNVNFSRTEYSTRYVGNELGWNVRPWAIVALGYDKSWGDVEFIGANTGNISFNSAGPYIRFGYDTLDNINFPSSGQLLSVKYQALDKKSANEKDSSHTGSIKWLGAVNFKRHSFALNMEFGGTDSKLELPVSAQDLGGYHNLSGYDKNQISSRYKAFGAVFYYYRLARNDFGAFEFPAYFGLSIERGNVWNERADIDFSNTITSASISVGVDSTIGPVILGYGRTNTGEDNIYLFLGTIF